MQYLVKSENNYQDLVLGEDISKYPIMLRIHVSRANKLPNINRVLARSIENGEMEAIFNRYNVQYEKP